MTSTLMRPGNNDGRKIMNEATTHNAWVDADDEGFQAICPCGWQSDWLRIDQYASEDDPTYTAHEDTADLAERHSH
jgi:hypothetical protein